MFFLPTYKRPDRLEKFITSYRETKATAPVYVMIQGRDNLEAYQYLTPQIPPNWKVALIEQNIGFVAALNYGLSVNPGLSWYGVICDDHEPKTFGWDQKLINSVTDWTFVSPIDNSDRNQWRHNGPPGWGGELIRAVGFVMPPCNWHMCGDDWWQLLGRTFSIWSVLINVRVDHQFVGNTGDVGDETNESSYRDFDKELAKYHFWLGQHGVDIMERVRIFLQANDRLPKESSPKFIYAK